MSKFVPNPNTFWPSQGRRKERGQGRGLDAGPSRSPNIFLPFSVRGFTPFGEHRVPTGEAGGGIRGLGEGWSDRRGVGADHSNGE